MGGSTVYKVNLVYLSHPRIHIFASEASQSGAPTDTPHRITTLLFATPLNVASNFFTLTIPLGFFNLVGKYIPKY